MFERDKDDLRSLGVPIEVGSIDPLLRRRARLPDPRRRVPAARDRADRRRGGRGRRSPPGLAARPARRGHHRGGPQADRVRAPGRPVGPRRRRAAAHRRRAVVRRVLGGHPGPARRSSSTTSGPARPRPATRHLQPWGVVRYSGRWYVVGLRHRPRRGAGLPALPGPGRRPAAAASPGRTTSRPGSTSARWPAGSPRRLARRAGHACWSGTTPAAGCAARRPRSRPTYPAPTSATALGPAGPASAAAWRSPTSCSAYGADVYVESPPALRERAWSSGSAPSSGEGRMTHHARPELRQGPGRPAADAGALPPRPRRGARRRGRRRPRRLADPAGQRPQGAVHVRAARAATPTT